jgi:CBS-domain-containing membrane protein
MLTIADIMTRDVFTLTPDLSAADAAAALVSRGFSGAPVRDAAGRVLGVLSRTDLTDPDRRPPGSARSVADLMTPGLLALRASDPVMSAVRLMVREEVHRIVVLDEHGGLAGIVTPSDVLRALIAGDDLQDPGTAGDHSDPPSTLH